MDLRIDVIIVEDDPMVLELHRQYVGRLKNFRLTGFAQNGEDCLKLIAKLRPQLAIIDIYLPGMDGLKVLKTIRNEGLNTDVIMVTAAHNAESIQQGIQYGAVDYIIKPFTFQRFKQSLINYTHYINKLKGKSSLSQKDIDMLKANAIDFESAEDSAKLVNLPKGLQKSTLRVIIDILKKKTDYFTAQEISDALGISRVTVRRYLQFLNANGCLKEILSYGPVGRPMQKFIVNQETFFRQG